jgi:hypothetical protein
MSTPFKELPGSPQESYDSDGMKAQRQLICAWSDRNALVEEILGPGFRTGALTPIAYPDVPTALAAEVEVEPLMDDMLKQDLEELTEGLSAYQGFAKVTIKYETSLT